MPIGTTGSVSKQLWNKVVENLGTFYPQSDDLHDAIKELGVDGLAIDDIITNTIKAIGILQKS